MFVDVARRFLRHPSTIFGSQTISSCFQKTAVCQNSFGFLIHRGYPLTIASRRDVICHRW